MFAKLPSITKSIKVGVTPTHAWYSGMGDDYKAALSRTATVPAAGTTTLAFKTWSRAVREAAAVQRQRVRRRG